MPPSTWPGGGDWIDRNSTVDRHDQRLHRHLPGLDVDFDLSKLRRIRRRGTRCRRMTPFP